MSIKNEAWVRIDIEKLVPADWNYKKDDDEKERKLRDNLKRIGQIENIIVRELKTGFYEVVNGNHRLKVFREADIKEPVCFNLGRITDTQARRIAVETNELRFNTNTLKMAEVLRDVIDGGEWLVSELARTMPFDEKEIEMLRGIAEPSFDFSRYMNQKNAGEKDADDDENTIVCPNCGHKFQREEGLK